MSFQDNINGIKFNCPAINIYQDYTRSSRLYNDDLANKIQVNNSKLDLNDPETYKNYLLNNSSEIRSSDSNFYKNNYICTYNK